MGIVGVDKKNLYKKDPRFKLVKREARWFDREIEKKNKSIGISI
jgi:hypothetical protein